ncbi:TPA: (Fe-S)-binding protein, partial [Candidatus Bathyarchaeota archaeon]|nr:(Fe-S)-binding protein [Candidatus Bathyarchaeota archaeon]
MNVKFKKRILYWRGCMFRLKFPEVSQAFEKILQRAKINFETVKGEGCCGALLFLMGFLEDAKKNAARVLKKLKGKDYEALVTGCPACYRCFSKFYPKFEIELPFEVMHVSHMLEELLKEKKLKLKAWDIKVAYHDPC